jgi:hypothetical protein
MRIVLRSIHEGARDMARAIAKTDAGDASRRDRKKVVEMLFAHLKRILRLGRLRLRGPCGASDEFLLAATAQNLRKLAKLRPKLGPVGQVEDIVDACCAAWSSLLNIKGQLKSITTRSWARAVNA